MGNVLFYCVPLLKNNITMLCKYYIKLGSSTIGDTADECLEVSDCIKNLDSLKVSYTRNGLGGVVRKCGSEIEFTGKAYDAIVSYYSENYLQSCGVFAVFVADDRWRFSKLWDCPLDFATLQYDGYVATIGCVDNGVAAIIKANKKSKYEFPVSEVAEAKRVKYDGVTTRRTAKMFMIGQDAKDYSYDIDLGQGMIIPSGETYEEGDMYYDSGVESAGPGPFCQAWWPDIRFELEDFQSQKVTFHEYAQGNSRQSISEMQMINWCIDNGIYFAEALMDCNLNVNLYIHFKIGGAGFVLATQNRIIKRFSSEDLAISFAADLYFNETIALTRGEKLVFVNTYIADNPDSGYVIHNYAVWASNTSTFWIDETESELNNKYWDCFRPKLLLQKLLDKIFEQQDVYVRGLVKRTDDVLNRTKIVAAETIRNISGAKVYTSFNEFEEFMDSVFGFVYTVTERTDISEEDALEMTEGKYKRIADVEFVHRTELFNNKVSKTINRANNIIYSFDDSMVYSSVEVGYPKKDYRDDNNARNEFNFTNYYNTGVALNDDSLTLLCPYRADCYGMEELVMRQKKDESTDSDDDLFLVVVTNEETLGEAHTIDRNLHVSNAYSDRVFNAELAPNMIVLNNKERIASVTKMLNFTSTDGNPDAVIASKGMTTNIDVNGQIFKVGKISIDTGDTELPETWNGLIEFEYNGKTYRGYLESVDINFANTGTLTYNLIEKCIE